MFRAPRSSLIPLFLCLFVSHPAIAKVKWKEIDQGLLAETQGTVDPQAPSETVNWDVDVNDSWDGKGIRSAVVHYRRVKIYTEHGRELETTVEIPYTRGERVDDIYGRTIRPNGTVVELKKDAIFDRTTVKTGGLKGKSKSFAMPGVEPGAVIEYQWSVIRRDDVGLVLYTQRSTPIRSMRMTFTPLEAEGFEMRVRSFNIRYGDPERKGGTMTIRLAGIRGLEKEPYMPPENQVRPWFLVEYAETKKEPSVEQYWKDYGKELYQAWKPFLALSPAVRRTADSLTAGKQDFEQRVQALHDFCRTRIRNVHDDAYDFTDAFRDKLYEDDKRLPEETLRRGYGTGADIDLLFAALAEAAGFKSRMAMTADRSERFFRRDDRLRFQLSEYVTAVNVNGAWKFYDPAIRDVPAGMLPWWEESQDALIVDPDEPLFVTTQLSLPSRSLARRAGTLRLDPDGTLTGDVRETYTGHLAAQRRENLDELSPSTREEEVRKELRGRWASAQVDSIRLSGMDDPLEPVGISYRVTVPDYVDRAGKRLLLQPDLFQRGVEPTFTASTRTHWLYFRHPWSEEDSLTIELPVGYQADADAPPEPLQIGRTITHRMAAEVDGQTVRLHRYLAFGSDGMILVDPSEYGRVKKAFESILQRDAYTISLRQVEGAAGR